MVRDAARRKRKFEGRIHPERIGAKFGAQKELMTEQQGTYFSEISDVERKVKQVCEAAGVPGFEVAQYINVGRKCYSLAKKFSGATRDAEAQHVVDHWAARGLNGPLLQQACVAGGCHPTAPPAPPTVGALNDLTDVEISDPQDCEFLHYDGVAEKWKNEPIHRKWSWADEQGWRKLFVLPLSYDWHKYAGNPVFQGSGVSGSFDEDGVHAPCILRVGTYYYLFYKGVPAAGDATLGVARSTSLYGPFTRLNAGNPILTPPAGSTYAAPSVVYDEYETDPNRRWKIWFAKYVTATGLDQGTMYSYSANPDSGWSVPVNSNLPVATMTWRWAVTILKISDRLYYALKVADAGAGSAHAVCYSSPGPMGPWTSRGNAVLCGGAGTWDEKQISFFSMTYITGVFYVFYSGQDAAWQWQSGLALSTDLRMVENLDGFKKWLPNPILGKGGVGDPDENRAHNPNFIQVDNTMYVFYHGIDGAGVNSICVATIP